MNPTRTPYCLLTSLSKAWGVLEDYLHIRSALMGICRSYHLKLIKNLKVSGITHLGFINTGIWSLNNAFQQIFLRVSKDKEPTRLGSPPPLSSAPLAKQIRRHLPAWPSGFNIRALWRLSHHAPLVNEIICPVEGEVGCGGGGGDRVAQQSSWSAVIDCNAACQTGACNET